MPVCSNMIVRDYRWILLLALSFLISLQAFNGNVEQALTKKNQEKSVPLTWREKALIWDSSGPAGAGVYGGAPQTSLPYIDKQGIATEIDPLVSPRLAVFTFRPFDLNQVDADTLQIVKGIGPKLADAIVKYRQAHGQFYAVDELLAVKGIGKAKLATLRKHVGLHPVQQ